MGIGKSTFGKGLARKIAAVPLSVALAVGLAPQVAAADDLAVADGVGLNAMAAGSGTALSTMASSKSLYSEYLPVLFHAANGLEEFADDYRASGSAQWSPEYFMFDIGDDGVPELLVRTTTFAGSKVVHAFTVKSGKLVSLGTYLEGPHGTAGGAGGKLFVAGWDSDCSYVNVVSISGSKIVSKFVKSGKATATEPSKHVRVVTDYLTAQGASWLAGGNVSDYAALKSEGKYSLSKATVTVASGGTYTGVAKTPKVTVKFMDTTLVKGTDYKVSYKNNKNAGTATVTITGAGNYKGTNGGSFTIAKATNPMTVKAAAKSLGASAVAKAAQTFKPLTVAKAQGKVTYKSASASAVAKVCTVNASTGAVTVKKGAAKGTYAVKVKATAAGNGNYKALSKTAEVKVTVK